MIYIFRKEIRKWHTVLWIVLFAFVIGSAPILWRMDKDKAGVARVNGVSISEQRYKQSYLDIQRRMRELQRYAKVFGLSAEDLLKEFFGKASMGEIALDSCIREVLLDQVKDSFNLRVDNDFFKEELVRTLPQELIDERGRIDLNSYEAYLRNFSLTPSQYEDMKEEEFKRNFIGRFITNAFYMPQYQVEAEYLQDTAQKSFSILVFGSEQFLQETKKKPVSDEELKAFYEANKQKYRVPEKRKAVYYQVSAAEYANKIVIDEAMMHNYYDKNVSSKFRVAPRLQVRHIFVKSMDKAKEALQLVKENPDNFAEIAKKHSEDSSASQGGLTKMFERGAFDPAFDEAAFRLYKTGELSNIVKTAKGYEIIQLVERVKAVSKTFEEVQPEIVKILTAKKALSKLKSDLEMVVHKMKSSDEALMQFVKENNLKKEETQWLLQSDSSAETLDGHMAGRLYSTLKGQQEYGYFFQDDTYIVYKLAGVQESYVRSLNDIKTEVLEYFYKVKTKETIKNAIKDAKAAVFAGKDTLARLATKYNARIIQVENIRKNDTPAQLKDTGDFVARMFALADKAQLLQYKHEKEYYLAQLDNCVLSSTKASEKELETIKNEKMMNSRVQLGVFIEFLKRNAKIDIDKKMLRVYNGGQ